LTLTVLAGGGVQKQKATLAKQLNLRPRQVEVWFQNRRARYGACTEKKNSAPRSTHGELLIRLG